MNRKHMIVAGVFAAAFAAVAYLGWAMLIRPMDKKISAKRTEKDDVSKKLDVAREQAAQYDKFKAQAENIRRDLNLISRRMDPQLSERETTRLTSWFLSYSSLMVTKVLVEKREKSKEPSFGNMDTVSYSLTFKGGFHEVGNFLNAVVSRERLLVPQLLDFKQTDEATLAAGGSMEGTIKIGLFVEPLK